MTTSPSYPNYHLAMDLADARTGDYVGDKEELEAEALRRAEAMAAGTKVVAEATAFRTREELRRGRVYGGFGRDEQGQVWVDAMYVDYAYRGPLR